MRAIERAESADPAAFLPVAYRDLDELEGFLEHLVREVHEPGFRTLLQGLLEDAPLRAEWRRAPCTRAGHHAYLGGLLEHTVAVATLALEACQLHPRLNSDLLLTAAIVHDLGKTREFSYGAELGLSDEGRLLGHLVLGQQLLEPRLRRWRRSGAWRCCTACSATTARSPRPAAASAPRRRSRCTASTRSTRASRARWSTASEGEPSLQVRSSARSSPTRRPREFRIGAAASVSGTAAARPSSERASATPAGATARTDAVADLERERAAVGEADRQHALGADLRHQSRLGAHQLGVDRALVGDQLGMRAHRRRAAVARPFRARRSPAARTRRPAPPAGSRTCASRSRRSPPRTGRRRRTPRRRSRASPAAAGARRGSSRRAASPRRCSGRGRTRACPSSCGGSATAARRRRRAGPAAAPGRSRARPRPARRR